MHPELVLCDKECVLHHLQEGHFQPVDVLQRKQAELAEGVIVKGRLLKKLAGGHGRDDKDFGQVGECDRVAFLHQPADVDDGENQVCFPSHFELLQLADECGDGSAVFGGEELVEWLDSLVQSCVICLCGGLLRLVGDNPGNVERYGAG